MVRGKYVVCFGGTEAFGRPLSDTQILDLRFEDRDHCDDSGQVVEESERGEARSSTSEDGRGGWEVTAMRPHPRAEGAHGPAVGEQPSSCQPSAIFPS